MASIADIWTRAVLLSGDSFYVGTSGADDMSMDATVIGLAGMAGDDTLRSGAEDSFLFGDFWSVGLFDNNDPYDFSVVGNDKLFGGGGEDILVGGPGNDTLIGGSGGDVYFLVGNGPDIVIEQLNSGKDTVFSTKSSYTLTDNVENLIFANIRTELLRNVRGTGNGLANTIQGGFGDDTLSGAGGNDVLSGSKGRDVLTGGAGSDDFAFGFRAYGTSKINTGAEADIIRDFNPAKDQIILNPGSFTTNSVIEGVIKAARFGLIGSTLTGNELVLYDSATGNLMTSTQEVFAHVMPGTAVTYLDFEWAFYLGM